jgi:acyl-CoA thioester hydrolase
MTDSNGSIPTPLDTYRDVVRPEWIDHNEHMNMGFYVVVFDFATDDFFRFVGLDRAHRQRENITTFSLEAHVTYQREVRLNDPLRFTTRLINFDAKRIHYLHEMYHADEGYLASTNELMSLHVSQETRRSAPMKDEILARLADIKAAHAELPPSPNIGRIIGLKAKPTTI